MMTFYGPILLAALFSPTLSQKQASANYLGRLCNTDWAQSGAHIYSKTLNTSQCWKFCYGQPAKYAGLLFGRLCFCASDLPIPDALCSPLNESSVCQECVQKSPALPCPGDASMTCGGQDWFDLYQVGGEDEVSVTSCETPLNALCSAAGNQEQQCRVRCNIDSVLYPACVSSYSLVGTGEYASTSGICAAALHALQLNVGQARNVLVKRRIVDVENSSTLQGSWNRGFASEWASNVTDTFQFVSSDLEYNNESGFFMFHQYLGPLFDNIGYCINDANDSQTLLILDAKNRVINFTNTTNFITINRTSVEGYLMCAVENISNQIFMRNVLTIVPIYTQECIVLAETLTKIMYENDTNQSIVFHVENWTDCKYEKLFIVKSKKVLATFKDEVTNMTLHLGKVIKADSGIYEVHGDGKRILAVSRLMILSPNLKNVSETKCEARGYFMEGEAQKCTCFHPYTGDQCEEYCSVGQFGSNCSYKCAAPECTGQLICKVDPVGCHCATGWQGAKCDKMCSKGTFGPDCMFSKTCHCLNDTGCDVFFGKCDHGCKEFYYGEDCTLMGPSLSKAPYVGNATFNSVTLNWQKWSKNKDIGDFEPTGYILQYTAADDASTWLNATANTTTFDDLISCQVNNLSTHVSYRFRVVALYNNHMQAPSPTQIYYTRCGRPEESIIDLQFESINATLAKVSWQMPDASTWNCDSVQVVLEVTCESKSSADVTHTIIQLESNETWSLVNINPYSTCQTNGSLITTTDDKQSESVFSTKIDTPESIPEIMDDPEVDFLKNTDIMITWHAPKRTNGLLLSYKIEIDEKNEVDNAQMIIIPADRTDFLINAFSIHLPFTLSLSASTSVGFSQPISIDVAAPTLATSTSASTTVSPDNSNSTPLWVAIGFLIFFVLILIGVIAAGAIYIRRQNQVIYRVSPSISMRANRSSTY